MWERAPILIVDDDEAVLKMIALCLTAWGYPAVTCRSGWEAISWLQDHQPPALMLIDVIMPDVGGGALATLIRSEPKWAEIPVAFMSGMNEPPPVPHVQFLPKPLGIGLLYALVTTYSDRLAK